MLISPGKDSCRGHHHAGHDGDADHHEEEEGLQLEDEEQDAVSFSSSISSITHTTITDYATSELSSPVVNKKCQFCFKAPCLLEQGLQLSIQQRADEIRDDSLEGIYSSNFVRTLLSCHAKRWIHGYRHKRQKVQLPQCVKILILQVAPPPFTDDASSPSAVKKPKTSH